MRVEVRTLGYAWTRTYDILPAEPVRALLSPSPIGLEALDVVGSDRPGDPLPSFRDGFVIDTALMRILPAMLDTDVGRAAASSPSMSAPSDFTSIPYLRGGSSHGTPVLLDGVRLFKPFHFGGFISSINPEVVRSATVLAGPGADRLAIGSISGAIDIATRDGSRDRRRTAGSLGLASTRFSVEGPIGGSVSYLVGARRTHPGILLGQLPREHGDAKLDHTLHRDYLPSYSFHDLHAKVTKDLGGVRRFSVSGHLNSESINLTWHGLPYAPPYPVELPKRESLTLAATAFSAHYRDRLGGDAIIDANLGHSKFAGDLLTQNTAGLPHQGIYEHADTSLFGEGSMSETRADLRVTWHAGSGAITAGAQATRFQGDHAYHPVSTCCSGVRDVFPELAVSAVSWRLAAHSSVAVPLWGGFSARGGVRGDRFQGIATTFAPFGELRYAESWWSARASGSRSYQELASLRNEEVLLASMVAYDLLVPVAEAPVPRSTELSLGWDASRGKLRVRLDAYTRHLDHLKLPGLEPHPGAGTVLVDTSLWKSATGTARGIEATWSWMDDRGLSLLGSYRWASASRTVGSRTYTPRFHREHEFELASSFRRGASSWSARVVLGSGQPHTPRLAVVPGRGAKLPTEYEDGTGAVFLTAEHNSARLPHYARIDVGWRRAIEVRWLGGGTMVPYVTLANLLNRSNVVGWKLGGINCTLGCPGIIQPREAYRQIPLFPFIGVEFRF